MAEITSGDVTVLVLDAKESDALGRILENVARYSDGPWGDAVSYLYEVFDSFGIVTHDPEMTYEIGFVNNGDGTGWWLVTDAAGESHGGRFLTHEEAEEYAEGRIEMFEEIQERVSK